MKTGDGNQGWPLPVVFSRLPAVHRWGCGHDEFRAIGPVAELFHLRGSVDVFAAI